MSEKKDLRSTSKLTRNSILAVSSALQIVIVANLIWFRWNQGAFENFKSAVKTVCQALIVLMYPVAVLAFKPGADEVVSRKKYFRLVTILIFALLICGAVLL